ncbi:MAG: hypothetical protein H7096_10750 [Flavobacterium sp.]|nr:hypothetical protein [Pedobacter sp.]
MNLELLRSKKLVNYPSGSTMSTFQDHIYLMGDDASSMLILDDDFTVIDTIKFFDVDLLRIQKTKKADIESSEWLMTDGKPKLWLFGSGSLSPQRDSAFCYDPESKKTKSIDLIEFYNRLRASPIPELNIEAVALVKNQLIFGSRGNLKHKQNFIIVTTANGFLSKAEFSILPIMLPEHAGISGMTYIPEKDLLLITSSEESTSNAFEDGKIGESYLGFVFSASSKIKQKNLVPDEWINLADINLDLSLQKIESVCILRSSDEDKIKLILVSDDDKGGTMLFELRLSLSK